MKNHEMRNLDLTQGIIWKQILYFVVPLILTALLQQAYNTVDLLIVGNLSDSLSMAAIGATASLIFMMLGLFMGLATGASVVVAQAFGAKDSPKTSRAVHTTYALALLSGLFLTVFAWFAAPFVLDRMGTPPEIFQEALVYTRIYFLGSIPLLIYNMGTGILRAVGDSRSPLVYLIISTITNIVLDLIFVGPLNMRAAGAAWATFIAQCLTSLLLTVNLMNTEGLHRLDLHQVRVYKEELKEIVSIGLPAGIQSALISFSNVLIQSRINSFGHEAIAGISAANRYDGFMMVGLNSFMMASTTFTGQNIGAKKVDRLKQGARTTTFLGVGFSVVMSIILLIFGRPLMGLFSQDPSVIEYGYGKILIYAPFHWIFTSAQVLSGVIRGAGQSLYPMLVSIFCMVGIRTLWNYPIAHFFQEIPRLADFGASINLVHWSYPVSWVITFACVWFYYRTQHWLPENLRHLYHQVDTGESSQ